MDEILSEEDTAAALSGTTTIAQLYGFKREPAVLLPQEVDDAHLFADVAVTAGPGAKNWRGTALQNVWCAARSGWKLLRTTHGPRSTRLRGFFGTTEYGAGLTTVVGEREPPLDVCRSGFHFVPDPKPLGVLFSSTVLGGFDRLRKTRLARVSVPEPSEETPGDVLVVRVGPCKTKAAANRLRMDFVLSRAATCALLSGLVYANGGLHFKTS